MIQSERLKYLMLIIVLISIAAWYYWHPRHLNSNPTQAQELPDAIVTGVRVLTFDEQGQLSNRVYAPKMVHFIKDNISLFTHPAIVIYNKKDQAPWLIKANRASALHGDEEIDLMGHVRVHQPRLGNQPESMITTEFLRYYPRQKKAKTDHYIELKRPGLVVSSFGMEAALDSEQISLLSKARGQYDPSKVRVD